MTARTDPAQCPHDGRYQRFGDDGKLFCTVCEIERLREDLAGAIDMIRLAYDAMHSEYMPCPWCTGNIGYGNEQHDDYCAWLKINPASAKGGAPTP